MIKTPLFSTVLILLSGTMLSAQPEEAVQWLTFEQLKDSLADRCYESE